MTVAYDSKGNTTATTDALGNDINYSYDSKGQLTSVTDEIGTYMNIILPSHISIKTRNKAYSRSADFFCCSFFMKIWKSFYEKYEKTFDFLEKYVIISVCVIKL